MGRLVEEVLKDTDVMELVWDRIKRVAFQADVEEYLTTRFPRYRLFPQWSLSFADSTKELGLQAADVFAGTARILQYTSSSGTKREIISLIQKRTTYFRLFPALGVDSEDHRPISGSPSHDEDIEKRALKQANDYVAQHKGTEDIQRRLEVEFLYEFLAYNHLQTDDTWVSSAELARRYSRVHDSAPTTRAVQAVIGRLRDRAIPIVGRRSGGYRLAASREDLLEFVKSHSEKIGPMLRRVSRVRELAQRATDNTVDILDDPCFRELRRAVDATEGWESTDPNEADHD